MNNDIKFAIGYVTVMLCMIYAVDRFEKKDKKQHSR